MRPDHIVIFSHGFGVYADDRGLFPDIIKSLKDIYPIMFDYNQREANNTLIASTPEAQTEKLRQVYSETRTNNPDATVDLICHSQGCIIAAMAQLEGVRKTIFLAPPDNSFGQSIDQKIEGMKRRPGTKILPDGSISYPRRDGSTTIIPTEYWDSRKDVKPVHLYNALVAQTGLIIVQATNDEVIGLTDFSGLSQEAKVIQMDTGHDFEGEDRQKVADLVARELKQIMSKPRIVIVNENDEVITHKERGTLTKDDIYRVSALWVKNSQGDILLAQRKFTKSHDPGKWGPAVAGTIDEGETYEQNIIKEAEEEIGLKDIKPISGPKIRVTGEYNYFDQWYTLVVDILAEDFVIQEEEVEQVKWFTRAELESELLEHPEKYLKGLDWPLENL